MHPIKEALILLLDQLAENTADRRIAAQAVRLSQEIHAIDDPGTEETIG